MPEHRRKHPDKCESRSLLSYYGVVCEASIRSESQAQEHLLETGNKLRLLLHYYNKYIRSMQSLSSGVTVRVHYILQVFTGLGARP